MDQIPYLKFTKHALKETKQGETMFQFLVQEIIENTGQHHLVRTRKTIYRLPTSEIKDFHLQRNHSSHRFHSNSGYMK